MHMHEYAYLFGSNALHRDGSDASQSVHGEVKITVSDLIFQFVIVCRQSGIDSIVSHSCIHRPRVNNSYLSSCNSYPMR